MCIKQRPRWLEVTLVHGPSQRSCHKHHHHEDLTSTDTAEFTLTVTTVASSARRIPVAAVQAIDTTGAGDAFNGALAAIWAERPDAVLADLLPFAIAFAGLSTERRGAALAIPRRAEVASRFAL